MKQILGALKKDIARWTDHDDLETTAITGLSLLRRNASTEPFSGMYEPSICVVAQGAKRVILGDDTLVYDSSHYLITSVHLPTMVQIINASEEKPYLGLVLKLDLREISQMMVDGNLPAPRVKSPTVSETAPLAGSQATHAHGTHGCGDFSIPGWLREPFTVQSGIQPPVRCTSIARYRKLASKDRQ